MKPYLIDTHCHVHFPAYDADREQVLARMKEKRIWGITIGTASNNSKAGIVFAEAHEGIWCTVGLHPSHTTSNHQDAEEGHVDEKEIPLEELVAMAKSSKKVVAIGEAGLDFYRFETDSDTVALEKTQEQVFRTHLAACHETGLPIVIHCREALSRLAEIIQEEWNAGRKPRGVVHSFTGTWEEAKPLIDLGLHIAVNGIATFPLRKGQDESKAINRTIERIPMEKLLLETDSPYLAPGMYRGKRNEPAWMEEVAKHVAAVRGMSLEDVAEQTTENAITLFELK